MNTIICDKCGSKIDNIDKKDITYLAKDAHIQCLSGDLVFRFGFVLPVGIHFCFPCFLLEAKSCLAHIESLEL